jgi:hypothetical protein
VKSFQKGIIFAFFMGYIDYTVEFLNPGSGPAQSPYVINTPYTLRLTYVSGEQVSYTMRYQQINFTLQSPSGNYTIDFQYYSQNPYYQYTFDVQPNFSGPETGLYKVISGSYILSFIGNFPITITGDVNIVNNNRIFLTNGLSQMNVSIYPTLIYTDTVYKYMVLENIDPAFTGGFYPGTYNVNIQGLGSMVGYVPIPLATNQITLENPNGLHTDQVQNFPLTGTADAFVGDPSLILLTLNFSPAEIHSEVYCFHESTNILCLVDDKETLVNVHQIIPGTLVKSFGLSLPYTRCKYIVYTKFYNAPANSSTKDKFYVEAATNLILCGGHSLLVDDLTDKQTLAQSIYWKDTPMIGSMYKALVCFCDHFNIYQSEGYYDIYAIVLDTDDPRQESGVYVSGSNETDTSKVILVESMTDHFFSKCSGMKVKK